MKKNLFCLSMILLSSASFAATYTPVHEKSNFEDTAEFKAIMEQLKPYGTFVSKAAPSVDVVKPDLPQEMGKGQRAVEEAKARNRAILAGMKTEDKKINEQITDNNLSEMDRLKLETKKVQEGWKKEIAETRAQWKHEQDIFLGRIKIYKENTFVIPAPAAKEKIIEKKEIPALPDAYIVGGALTVPVRDQKDRPTCAAFAGIRAMEILLAQNKVDRDLSEQYFYWASKPACQSSPCSEKGSWVTFGLDYSKEQPKVDIPTEQNCAYKDGSVPQNETQLPITSSCHMGVVKVESYETVRTLADVIEKIKNDTPVVVSAKLTPNFYLNQGLITLADENKGADKMNSHSLGHAFLAVGVIELPEKMLASEGRYCIVVTNSWGMGWGAGGFSCITENWFTKNRGNNPFVAITKVSAE
jgi:C1A family cysteine protease